MINRDRILKLLRDLKEWESEFRECIYSIERCDENIKKFLFHSIRAYFLDFHILCEDYISISLKHLNKFKVDISAIEGMEIIKNSSVISNNFFEFYTTSRRLRNRLAHRYKMPKDEELLLDLKNNLEYVDELEKSIKDLINLN
ncbi:HepT-like ribonuclease domain-containing protein [Clostridium sp.]|uniref:HepT-like ribonuclease domain-containing protein n=1 Tax=Clostridium sp. TaxID=1506 RepID=UPI002631A87A|nr:HepT-like ribonuclease domain-containing protein [Clostridium sp.]